MKKMKVLFVARRFPPSIGGMEQFAYDLSEALPDKETTLVKVTWGGSSRLTLIFALPWLFLKSLWQLWTDRSIDIIHMQDAVMSPVGWLLSKLSRRPWVVVAHGLDLTFTLAFYQKVNIFFARKAASMIAISEATAEEARQRGISSRELTVIPLGVDGHQLPKTDRVTTRRSIGLDKDAPVLLTVGRLAKRKGVAWFIGTVLPKLPDNVHYVVIGEGTEQAAIKKAIQINNLSDRVHLLGAVDLATKEQWLAAADIFVMPNVRIAGDMEGFGIVAHEAAMAGLPVVASNLEGIAQALQDGKNGFLLPPHDGVAYRSTITDLLHHPKNGIEFGRKARAYTSKHFGWATIAEDYRQVYRKFIP
jgi:phosphatidylinositol alpha-1,6-mannosyltransferase